MNNFVEQISIKFVGCYLIKMNLVQTVLKLFKLELYKQAHQNISKNSYIGRYSKDQISVDRYAGRSL